MSSLRRDAKYPHTWCAHSKPAKRANPVRQSGDWRSGIFCHLGINFIAAKRQQRISGGTPSRTARRRSWPKAALSKQIWTKCGKWRRPLRGAADGIEERPPLELPRDVMSKNSQGSNGVGEEFRAHLLRRRAVCPRGSIDNEFSGAAEYNWIVRTQIWEHPGDASGSIAGKHRPPAAGLLRCR